LRQSNVGSTKKGKCKPLRWENKTETLRLLIQFTLPNAPDDIMDESINPLTGETPFINNFLMNFETAFNAMSDNVFNLEHLHSKISDDIPLGYSNIPDPQIVILEPGKASNNDEHVHACM